MIKPTDAVPDLEVATVGGGTWDLAKQKPEWFTLVEFYRGYHCPRCKLHLLDLAHREVMRGQVVDAYGDAGLHRGDSRVDDYSDGNLAELQGDELDKAHRRAGDLCAQPRHPEVHDDDRQYE